MHPKLKAINYVQMFLLMLFLTMRLFFINNPIKYSLLIVVVSLMFLSVVISMYRILRDVKCDAKDSSLLKFMLTTINISYLVIVIYVAAAVSFN